MRRKYIVILSVLLLGVGMCVCLYPLISSEINELHSSYAVQNLNTQIETVQGQQLKEQLDRAEAYNSFLRGEYVEDEGSSNLLDEYNQILNFGNGIMGSISIPAIDLNLPIYHGVSDGILAKAVGHLPQSAFPVGGEGNHAVLTGHTGLPSAKLFTDLAKLKEEDLFHIQIADRVLHYQVDQIKVVLPSQTEDLKAEAGKDYCTLVTCTPYGVNSHRLLVRGIRVLDDAPVGTQIFTEDMSDPMELIVSAIVILSGLTFIVLFLARILPSKRRG